MVDVFLMGTAGNYNDPNRSKWREPIKAACARLGIECFDPVVPVWNEETGRKEAEALRTARVLVMAITSDTVGVASLAESGWTVLSAILRKQAVGLYVDPEYKGERLNVSTVMARIDTLINGGTETIEDASRRARKLVNSHASKLVTQFPDINLYVAKDLTELGKWTVTTAQKMRQKRR
jgi:Nucleoside 2-deoxyribosyltransferase like